MPPDDAQPPTTVRGYTRTWRPRPMTFTCQGCATLVTEERAPGPRPRYCKHCSTDPELIRRRARERKAAQRRRRGLDTSTSDGMMSEQPHTQTTADVTELAGAVTELSSVAESVTERTAMQPGHEELVVSVLVPGQRRMAHFTASELQSPPGTPASAPMPPASAPTAGTLPAAASSSKSTSRTAKQSRPAPKPLVVRVRNGHTHWLADDARTYCGRRVSARASVTQHGWASCATCEQRRTRISRADPAHTHAMQHRLTTADAADRLRVTPERLTALARDGALGQKIGRSWVFTAKEVDAYKRRKTRPGRQLSTVRRSSTTPRSRLSRADLHAPNVLDRLLAQEREVEQRYSLPFRAPTRIATTIHDCHRCYFQRFVARIFNVIWRGR